MDIKSYILRANFHKLLSGVQHESRHVCFRCHWFIRCLLSRCLAGSNFPTHHSQTPRICTTWSGNRFSSRFSETRRLPLLKATSHEPRATSHEPRATSHEPAKWMIFSFPAFPPFSYQELFRSLRCTRVLDVRGKFGELSRSYYTFLSWSPNFPRTSITRYTHAKYEPILKCFSRKAQFAYSWWFYPNS